MLSVLASVAAPAASPAQIGSVELTHGAQACTASYPTASSLLFARAVKD